MFSESQTTLFCNHVARFLTETHPHYSRRVVVAVSGGADSMLLLRFANDCLKAGHLDSLRAITIHHGTREGQDREVDWVQFEAQKLELSCEIVRLNLGEVGSNVEATLRRERHRALKEALDVGEELWMGHHLNDSWEWAQLQSARSSQICLGIPFKAGVIVRPFLCVTRDQITRCARAMQVRWVDDPTNNDTRFERNWIRRELSSPLKRRHPSFLKHYARRSQAMAEGMGLALGAKKKRGFSFKLLAPSSSALSVPTNSLN